MQEAVCYSNDNLLDMHKLWVSAGYRRIRDSEKLIYTIHTRMKDLDCVCKDESQNKKVRTFFF